MAQLFWPSLLVLFSGFAVACDDSGGGLTPLPCDIREASCQTSVFRITASVREQRGARQPPTRIITRDTFATERRGEAEPQQMMSRSGQAFEQALRMVRFLPETGSFDGAAADSEVEGVAAYYDPETASVTIIADAVDGDLEEGTNTLAHEYVHALQDQLQDLARVTDAARTTDEVMATRTFFEGEATVLADVVLARALDVDYELGALRVFFDRYLRSVLGSIQRSEAPLNLAILALPYPIGGRPLGEAYVTGGYQGVLGVFRKRPTTLAGWNDVARADELPLRLTCFSPAAPAGYTSLGADALGTTGLIALYTRLGTTGDEAFAAARAWTNDAFTLFVSEQGAVESALAWRIRMRDETAAAELESLLARSTLTTSFAREANEVVITGTSAPDVLASWTTRNECGSNKAVPSLKRLVPELGPRWPHVAHAHRGR